MGNFITLDEPMGPGFLIFFKKVRKSGDWINIRLPRPSQWGYDEQGVDIEKIREEAKQASRTISEVKKGVRLLSESRYTPVEIKQLVETRNFPQEVIEPHFDSDYVLIVIMEWYLTIKILVDDEEAILVLMLS
jgi:hypothetical protein